METKKAIDNEQWRIDNGELIMDYRINKIKMKQKQMPGLMFKIMTSIMSVKKQFRNFDKEINFSGLKSGNTVLDFGCGSGYNSIPAAKIVGLNGKIFALDIHKTALAVIREKIEEQNLINIETIHSDCDTGLKNNSVDIVFLHNTFPIIKNKKDVLSEIHRILKTNGKLSYMSRLGSRLMVKNKMTNKELTVCLIKEYNMELIKHKNGHLLFEKTEK